VNEATISIRPRKAFNISAHYANSHAEIDDDNDEGTRRRRRREQLEVRGHTAI
ncbi:hypothetical protein HMPREF0020_01182, partial [Acinetobacter baumannii 6013113]